MKRVIPGKEEEQGGEKVMGEECGKERRGRERRAVSVWRKGKREERKVRREVQAE